MAKAAMVMMMATMARAMAMVTRRNPESPGCKNRRWHDRQGEGHLGLQSCEGVSGEGGQITS
eukprot:1851231-Pyramimonas_sp.AAC.1